MLLLFPFRAWKQTQRLSGRKPKGTSLELSCQFICGVVEPHVLRIIRGCRSLGCGGRGFSLFTNDVRRFAKDCRPFARAEAPPKLPGSSLRLVEIITQVSLNQQFDIQRKTQQKSYQQYLSPC